MSGPTDQINAVKLLREQDAFILCSFFLPSLEKEGLSFYIHSEGLSLSVFLNKFQKLKKFILIILCLEETLNYLTFQID